MDDDPRWLVSEAKQIVGSITSRPCSFKRGRIDGDLAAHASPRWMALVHTATWFGRGQIGGGQ